MDIQVDQFILDKKVLWSVIGILVLFGFQNRFIQDDAFISFRYAEHLAEGHGLVWNVGEQNPVEGYTNFLWVLIMSLVEALQLDPVLWSMIIGLGLGAGTLFLTYKLSVLIFQSDFLALLTIILLGSNYTFSCYMTGGLETQLHIFLIVACVLNSFKLIRDKNFQNRRLLTSISLLFTLAIITRLDSVLICGILYISVVSTLFKTESSGRLDAFAFLTLPAMLLLGSWFIFKVVYYGDILPNTFYIKATGISTLNLVRGLWYVWSFLLNYAYIFFVFLIFFYFKRFYTRRLLRILILVIILWCVYIIKVGGGFMEYRLLVPVLPFIIILITYAIPIMKNKVRIAITLFLVLTSIHHGMSYKNKLGIERISSLHDHIIKEDQNWQKVGIVLGELFADSKDPVTIALRPVGAIPYYSKLYTIDLLGLNDRWIAKNGVVIGNRPGHKKYATLEYLLESDVNLVIGHPQVKPIPTPSTQNPQQFFSIPIDSSLLPNSCKVIEIPLNEAYKIDVLYLIPNHHIDKTIKMANLKTHHIIRR